MLHKYVRKRFDLGQPELFQAEMRIASRNRTHDQTYVCPGTISGSIGITTYLLAQLLKGRILQAARGYVADRTRHFV